MPVRIAARVITVPGDFPPLRWSLVCPAVQKSRHGPRHDSEEARCRTAAFPNRPTWPPAGLSAASDPRASRISRFKALAGPTRRLT